MSELIISPSDAHFHHAIITCWEVRLLRDFTKVILNYLSTKFFILDIDICS